MQHHLIAKWIGFVTLEIKGTDHEKLFQTCVVHGIKIWDIDKKSENLCICKTYTKNMKQLDNIIQQKFSRYEISIINEQVYLPYVKQIWFRKEYIIAFFLCIILLFLLSNVIWKVKISGVSTELEEKLTEQLASYGIYEGAWAYSIDSIESIQDDILNNMEELLYIGIERKGTSIIVDGIEKLIIKEKEKETATQLVAEKNGVIDKMFIKKGVPLVNTDDYVKKGDVLVSGDILDEEDKEGDENSSKTPEAEGEVYANTWYEVDVNSSIYSYREKLTGEMITQYLIDVGNYQLPVWPWKRASFNEQYVEVEYEDVYFIKWRIPIQIIKKSIYNKATLTQTRSEAQTKEYAIQQALDHLKLKLGKNTEIINYYVLQDGTDNGKVKLNLYVSVLEDIAISPN